MSSYKSAVLPVAIYNDDWKVFEMMSFVLWVRASRTRAETNKM